MDCATDNGEARPLNSAAHRYNTGNWNAAETTRWDSSGPTAMPRSAPATNSWKITASDREEESGITSRLTSNFICMPRSSLLRAYFYSELLRAFGGVPLIASRFCR
ncbi:MAG: hypothetical protein ACLVK4_16130 [Alistipes shahii]|uniref:hypothetical protein n=1 Tax=Alistipes shahii TaxID=328814 RepID=UPI00399D38B5